MEDFVVAKRGDYLLVKILCESCGNEIERTGKRGRPAKTCRACKTDAVQKREQRNKEIAENLLKSIGVQFRVNMNEEGETPNFVSVKGDEFWTAMVAKAMLRRQEQGEVR